MNKPKKQIKEYWDYFQCAKWVAYCLGIKDLEDIQCRYSKKNGGIIDSNIPYQNFWHAVIGHNGEIYNESFIWIEHSDKWPDWALRIVDKFEEEFNGRQKYWVEW